MRRFMRFLVRKVPRKYLIRFSFIFSSLVALFYKGHKYECPICGGHFRKLLPYGNKGATNRLCPKCLSLERHRLLWFYLQNKTGFFTEKLKVLHIAPEQSFYKRFRALNNLEYTTADLESPIADVKMNIKDMPFETASFDVVICNHVLEHIDDELKATSEVYRVLKPGGWAILQVPINYNLDKTFEDPNITSPKDREKYFGQYDHVRFHGLDYPKRLEKAGFVVDSNDYLASFSKEDAERYRLPEKEIIYHCKKL